MSLRNIGIVYRKELIDSLRDRRTVVSMIVVPLLVMPLLTIGMGVLSVTLVGLAMREIPKVMILGGEDSPHVRAEIQQLKDVRIVPAKPDFAEEISNKQIRAAVEIPEGFEAKLAAGESSTVKIYMYAGRTEVRFRRRPPAAILSRIARPDHSRASRGAAASRKPRAPVRHRGKKCRSA